MVGATKIKTCENSGLRNGPHEHKLYTWMSYNEKGDRGAPLPTPSSPSPSPLPTPSLPSPPQPSLSTLLPLPYYYDHAIATAHTAIFPHNNLS